MQKTKRNHLLVTSVLSLLMMITLSAFVSINADDIFNDETSVANGKTNPNGNNSQKRNQLFSYKLQTLSSGNYLLKISNNKNLVVKKIVIE